MTSQFNNLHHVFKITHVTPCQHTYIAQDVWVFGLHQLKSEFNLIEERQKSKKLGCTRPRKMSGTKYMTDYFSDTNHLKWSVHSMTSLGSKTTQLAPSQSLPISCTFILVTLATVKLTIAMATDSVVCF